MFSIFPALVSLFCRVPCFQGEGEIWGDSGRAAHLQVEGEGPGFGYHPSRLQGGWHSQARRPRAAPAPRLPRRGGSPVGLAVGTLPPPSLPSVHPRARRGCSGSPQAGAQGRSPRSQGPVRPPLNPVQNRSRHVPCPLGTGVGAEFGESLGHKRGEWAPTPWPPPADLASWPQGEWAQCVPRRLCQAAPDKGAFGVPGAGMPACGSMRGRAAPVASSPWLGPGHTAGLHCASTVQLQAPPSPA